MDNGVAWGQEGTGAVKWAHIGQDWTEVRNGVPQGSVLGPLLFVIFIDGIDEEVLCEISKFADDSKIASRVNTLNDVRSMQRTLDKLVAWANRRKWISM